MRTFSHLVGTTLLAASLACATDTAVPTALSPGGSPLAGKSRLTTVSLTVTVADADATGSPYGLRSDGKGVYTDGSQNVQAILDAYGTFAFNTRAGRQAAVRWVTYDFSRPVDVSNMYRPSPTNDQNYHFSTGPSDFSPSIPIQDLGINGNPSTQCMYMGNGIANSTKGWRVSFHKGNEDTSNSPTAYAVVTRTSVSPAMWTVQPVGSCSPNANVASLRSEDGTLLYGYFYLPFHMTLQAR